MSTQTIERTNKDNLKRLGVKIERLTPEQIQKLKTYRANLPK